MRDNEFAYIPGKSSGGDFPLRNFLPPIPEHDLSTWVSENQLADRLLIDPISANPVLPIKLAQRGYRVLASRSNPINWLLTEVMSEPDFQKSISSAVNILLISRRNDQTLEDTFSQIYQTACVGCEKKIQAQGFIWEKDGQYPIGKIYTCPKCGDSGERDIAKEDIENLDNLGNLHIYHGRAMQMVGAKEKYEKDSVLDALACYLPRALYVCMILANRLRTIELDKHSKKFLRAALLLVFNDAHTLRHWPDRDYRFLQLTVPQRYLEKNLYLSLLNAHQHWPSGDHPIPVTYWPKIPGKDGGICFFQSRLARKSDIFHELNNLAITTVFPRPGRAYWTLSALWAGWLWGKNAVKPIRSALQRRRYDWFWYAKAINKSFSRLQITEKTSVRIFGIFPYFTPNLLFGLFAGMDSAGFQLQGAAYRESKKLLQAEWSPASVNNSENTENGDLEKTIRYCLRWGVDPVNFQELLMSVIIQSSLDGKIANHISDIEESAFSRFNNRLKNAIDKSNYIQAISQEGSPGTQYYNQSAAKDHKPMAEEIERFVLQVLRNSLEISTHAVDRLVCNRFTGNLTPDQELVYIILDTYADREDHVVHLRENESDLRRKKDREEISSCLHNLGEKLGFAVYQDPHITWAEKSTHTVISEFFISNTLAFSGLLAAPRVHEKAQRFFIYPGSRAGLLFYRLQHDPRMAAAVRENWHLIKYRHIRRIAEREVLSLSTWQELIDSDPPLREPPAQMQIM